MSAATKADPLMTEKYLKDSNILILDDNSSARVALASNLVQLGATRAKMVLSGSMEEGRNFIQKMKPKVIFSNFFIGNQSGLDLIQEQRNNYEPRIAKQCIFALVTGNASQSLVARAAEEDVDTFIIKPYAHDTLKKTLDQVVQLKLNPSKYLQLIDEGKDLLASSHIDEATLKFKEALGLERSPTLAHFYLGQAKQMKEALAGAQLDYRDGLSYNKIHYKCLVGLYELLMKQNRPVEAYDIIRRIAQYFPANPNRLASVLKLAIITQNYDDIEGYYRIFTAMDTRTTELVQYICSAMAVTGKHYLITNVKTRAVEIFEKAAVTAAGKTQFLRFIVENLVNYNCPKEAESFLRRFPPQLQGHSDYLISQFLVTSAIKHPSESLLMGRKLIDREIANALVYEIVIRQSVELGHTDVAENLVHAAKKKFPDQTQEFEAVFKKLAPELGA